MSQEFITSYVELLLSLSRFSNMTSVKTMVDLFAFCNGGIVDENPRIFSNLKNSHEFKKTFLKYINTNDSLRIHFDLPLEPLDEKFMSLLLEACRNKKTSILNLLNTISEINIEGCGGKIKLLDESLISLKEELTLFEGILAEEFKEATSQRIFGILKRIKNGEIELSSLKNQISTHNNNMDKIRAMNLQLHNLTLFINAIIEGQS
jgi:hypothetical protein